MIRNCIISLSLICGFSFTSVYALNTTEQQQLFGTTIAAISASHKIDLAQEELKDLRDDFMNCFDQAQNQNDLAVCAQKHEQYIKIAWALLESSQKRIPGSQVAIPLPIQDFEMAIRKDVNRAYEKIKK